MENCPFCKNELITFKKRFDPDVIDYNCETCGRFTLSEEALSFIHNLEFSSEKPENEYDGIKVSVHIKNQYELNRKPVGPIVEKDLISIIKTKWKTPLEIMDGALIRINRLSSYAGEEIILPLRNYYTYFQCRSIDEFKNTLNFLTHLKQLIKEFIKLNCSLVLGKNICRKF